MEEENIRDSIETFEKEFNRSFKNNRSLHQSLDNHNNTHPDGCDNEESKEMLRFNNKRTRSNAS